MHLHTVYMYVCCSYGNQACTVYTVEGNLILDILVTLFITLVCVTDSEKLTLIIVPFQENVCVLHVHVYTVQVIEIVVDTNN